MGDIGLRLRHARKVRELTQVRLAAMTGIKQASISDLERGESKTFRGPTLISLARALKVNPEWLSNGKGPMERRDIPLSEDAILLAQAWQRLTPELQRHTAEMILAMVEQTDKFGPAVPDEKVAAAYGSPHKTHK